MNNDMKSKRIPIAFIEIDYDAIENAKRLMDRALIGTSRSVSKVPVQRKSRVENKPRRKSRIENEPRRNGKHRHGFTKDEIERTIRLIQRGEGSNSVSSDRQLLEKHTKESLKRVFYRLRNGIGLDNAPRYFKKYVNEICEEKGWAVPVASSANFSSRSRDLTPA